MRKFLGVYLLLIATTLSAQKNKPTPKPTIKPFIYTINTCIDSTGNTISAKGSSLLTCNHTGKKGFTIDVTWKVEKNNISFSGLRVKTMNLGNCLEKDVLVFTFEDNTQLTLNAWNEPNCDGNAIFDLDGTNYKEYSNKRIIAIRFQNGRTFETYLYKIRPEQRNFFSSAAEANKTKRYLLTKCS
jgi:hypothetical protein